MKHIVLLGDSIFDNKSYVGGGKDTIANLREQMPDDWKATLLAVDGHVTDGVIGQIARVPADATHLFVSVGGNDALGEIGILQMRTSSAAAVLNELSDVAARFENRYNRMLDAVLQSNKPTTVCTVYYPQYPDPRMQKLAVAALASFNDVIIRQAFLTGVPLIDLRYVCDEVSDYANPIEPSESGGAKIARTIIQVADEHRFQENRASVYTGSVKAKLQENLAGDRDARPRELRSLGSARAVSTGGTKTMTLSDVKAVGDWFTSIVDVVKDERERRRSGTITGDSILSGTLSKMLDYFEFLGVFVDFDYDGWAEEAKIYTDDIDNLLRADLMTLRRLLSYYRHESGATLCAPLYNTAYWEDLAMKGQLLRILLCFQHIHREIEVNTFVPDIATPAR